MWKLVVAVMLVSTPVMAQSNPLTGGVSNPVPPPAPGAIRDIRCKPIGKTASGEAVYAVSCKDVPVTNGNTR